MNVVTMGAPSWSPCDSYGRKAQVLRAHLLRRGTRVNALGPEAPDQAQFYVHLGGILFGYPTWYSYYGWMINAGPRVAVTAWESTKVPPGWVDALNACSAVSVGTPFVRDVLVAEGVTVPVEVHRLGLSAAYQHVERADDRPFTFLAIADRGDRKGRHDAVHAFVNAFGSDPNVRLILKSRRGGRKPLANANIETICEDYTDEQMAALYARCDCLVFPTKGEGFGLPPREFAATGGMVIATNWSGTADHIDEWGIPLDYRLVPAWTKEAEFRGLDLGVWAQPDVDHLITLMREVAALPLAARNARGKGAAARVRQRYSWSQFASGVYGLWRKVTEHARDNAAV